jgi:hypothetical protein
MRCKVCTLEITGPAYRVQYGEVEEGEFIPEVEEFAIIHLECMDQYDHCEAEIEHGEEEIEVGFKDEDEPEESEEE